MSKAAVTFYDTNKGLLPKKSQGEIYLGLFSGGLALETIKKEFSEPFNKHFCQIEEEGHIKEEVKEIFEPEPITENYKVLSEIYNGTNAAFENALTKLQKQAKMTDPAIVRMTLALLLKIADAVQDFVEYASSAKGPHEKINSLYNLANKMRIWYVEKKQTLTDATEEGFERKCKEMFEKVQGKIDFLLKFKFSDAQKQSLKLTKGKLLQSAINFLQSDISIEQVSAELERCYLQGITLLGVLNVCNLVFKRLPQKTSRIDCVTWIASILKRKDPNYWSYGTLLACGLTHQKLLREKLFVFLGEILNSLSTSRDTEELSCLLESLKWNYATTDHTHIKELDFLRTIHSPAPGIAELWGAELETKGRLPEMLLDTFEFVVTKISLQGVKAYSTKSDDASPVISSQKGTTEVLIEQVFGIVLSELNKAALSYQQKEGVGVVIATKYADMLRNLGKDQDSKATDTKKIRKVFLEESKEIYSPDFCARLLRLLYHLCVSANHGLATLQALILKQDFLVLFKLLEVGSSHQQFLVLQILPHLVTLAYDNLESAAQKHLSKSRIPQYTKSKVLNILLDFALERRAGIWCKNVATHGLGHVLSKCVIRTLQSTLNTKSELGTVLMPIMKAILFGKADEVRLLPKNCQTPQFIELMLSVAGGEFENLHKGATGYTKEKKPFSIVAFASSHIDPTKETVCEWGFSPKIHDRVLVHLVNEENTIHQMPIFEITPRGEIPDYSSGLLKNIDSKTIIELLQKLLKRGKSFANDTLSETLKVKLLKSLMKMLMANKALSQKVFSEDLVVALLNTALQYPKVDTSKSLLMAELAAEEMRKVAGQSESKALSREEGKGNFIIRKGTKLLFSGAGVRVPARIYAHLNLDKIEQNVSLEYAIYHPEEPLKDFKGKLVFIKEGEIENANLKELVNFCLGVVVSRTLEPCLKNIENLEKAVLLQISEKVMQNIEKIESEIEGNSKKLRTQAPEALMSEYMNIKAKKEVKANTLKGILQELVEVSEGNANKEIGVKYSSYKEIFDILLTPSDRRDAVFKEDPDAALLDEHLLYSKEYSMLFTQVHEKGEDATSEAYSALLHDLHVFCSRHLLLTVLIRNEGKIKDLPVDLYKRLLTFLLIASAEADLMKIAVQHRDLSQRLNKLLLVTLKRHDAVDVFLKWTHERVMDTVSKGRILSYSICGTPQSQLEKGIYLPFICRYTKLILRDQTQLLMTNKGLNTLIDDMNAIVIMADKLTEKYQAIGLIRKIIGTTSKLLPSLPPYSVQKILNCESIKALAQYFNHAERKSSIIWRIANEILLKVNVLCRHATNLYGEIAQTYYTKNAYNLFIASEIMREFPKMTLVASYLWGKSIKKDLRSRESFRINTPTPLYDTQYSVMVNDLYAGSLQVAAKKHSHRIALLSLDKDGCAELPSIEKEEEKFAVSGNRFYVQFPCDTYTTYGFGCTEGGKLGLKDVKETEEPQVIPELANVQVKGLASAGKHSYVVSTKDQMYCTGKAEGKVGGESMVFQSYKAHGASGCVATTANATIFYDQKGGTMYAIGKNPGKMFSVEPEVLTNEASIKPHETNITQISISSNHLLVLYSERQVYACPKSKKDLFSNYVEGASEFCLIRFSEEIDKVYKVLAVSCGTIILCTSLISGQKELYSFGWMDSPVLGQCDHQLVDEYGRLEYPEDIEFVDLTGNEQMAAAITSNGELYTWGCGPLGIVSEEGFPIEFAEKPTKVEFFQNYLVQEVSVGENHMLALASDKSNPEKIKVFAFGSNSKGQLGRASFKENEWTEIEFFTGKKPYKIAAGESASFVCCGEEVKGVTHKGTICSVTGVSPIKDIVFFRVDENGFQCWSKEGVEVLPPLVLATRNPINNVEEKKWHPIDDSKLVPGEMVECMNCKASIKDSPVYKSAVIEANTILCEACFFKTPCTFEAALYYRFSSPQRPAELPLYSLKDLYEVAPDTLTLLVSSVYKYEFPKSITTSAAKPSLSEFLADFKEFESQHDLDILDLLNDFLVNKDGKVEALSLKADLPLNYKKKQSLRKFSEEILRQRTKMLIKFNKVIRQVIDYIDFTSKSDSEDDLYTHYTKLKEYILLTSKDRLMKQTIMEGPKVKGRAECTIERAKAFALQSLGQVDHTGTKSLFGQLWQQLKGKIDFFKKRPTRHKFPFVVKFKNEGGIDAGGLFRETLDQLCEELQSTCLTLLIPTPNNRSAFGEYREKWTVNPSATTETNYEMYEFLGALIGMSLRLGHLLPLNLSSLFWKRLTGDPVDKADLVALDAYFVQYIEDIVNIEKKGVDEKTFTQAIDATFVTKLSDGSEIELVKNGRSQRVTFENRIEYVKLLEKVRLEEGMSQIKAIASGVFKIVPGPLLKLYSWRELEDKVCGKPTFSVDALKRITRYYACSEKDAFIQYFWQALEEFTDKERSLYLRFVWGRSRMPSYTERHIHELHLKHAVDPDNTLPIAHTCGFQIDLPAYSSVEKAKERLRIAIKWQTIDADRSNYETWTDYQ